ncbi:hypothetical protein EUX98_g3280 [Antrodiella citrinella]|uniref:F-box domain-containing protein n=1 Tax=Antrodiella citrinella TaxID=2447956 RepID=A0A4S4MWZ8_9APHY|nr:hypothetical protein EUX98_g3280 [Antrodiella citrinella]
MTRVTRLRIHSRNWDAYLGDGYFRAHGRSLVHLTLDGVQLDSFTTFTYTIAAFPKLESLSLLYVRWAARLGPARREDWADGRALNLKTLRMGWVFSTTGKLKEIVEWLRRGRTSPLSIERLALGATYPSDGDLLTVLPLLAPTLLHVEIFQRIHDIRGLLVQALDATLADPHFVRLKSVTVTGITYDSDLLNAAHYDAQVEEQLPLLARRDGIEVSIKMAYQDPRWFEIPPVTS